MPRNNKQQKSAQVVSLERRLARLQHSMNGCVVRPGPDPTPVVLNPIFNIVVSSVLVTTDTATEVVSVTDIRTALASALGGLSGATYVIRVLEVRLWGAVAGNLSCEFYDFTSSTLTTFNQSRDGSTLSTRPRLGWVFPSRVASTWVGGISNRVFEYSNPASTAPATPGEYHALCQLRFVTGILPD